MLRWKTTDPYSHADLGTVYQIFNITINYACYDASVTLNNNADNDADRTATVTDGAAAVVISGASTAANDYDGSNLNGISVCKW